MQKGRVPVNEAKEKHKSLSEWSEFDLCPEQVLQALGLEPDSDDSQLHKELN